MSVLSAILKNLPEGYSTVRYNEQAYGMTVSRFNGGKSMKVYAEELGGKDFISMNYYFGTSEEYFKPCEMPKEKVVSFIQEMRIQS
ncbi:MAG: peptide methionine sulfoxide reductase [Flavobacteriales bacterium]|nr:peptide methionine sulfoxide reductase [Flavobacteriales bacterium]MDG1781086.1 peptide methionine sulfoxide reductase [Flavobacteriales bacterium]MDG2246176.1 peptide methionine sulfoxide reductase [Flavobacteriales bacterium]